jgi:ribosomal protein S18 acetylase RimI-like enzyme
VVAYPRGDHWHLENVAVDPAAQGAGLGLALITHVEALARASGAQAVELYTNAKMIENRALYPRLGYAETGRAIEDGFDRVFYRKPLGRRRAD